MNTIKVKVLWFNRMTGEGKIRAEDGSTGYLFACNIKGKRTWYENTACVYFNKGETIEVYQDEDTGIVISETRGHFDKEKWDSLDHDRLAFVCNEDGEATNGLFK